MALFASRRQTVSPEAAPDWWMSYSDAMAGLIFTFILLMILIISGFRYQEQKVNNQAAELATAQAQIDQMRQQIAGLLGVKQDIIARLKAEFGDRIRIDEQTGAITFSDDVLFAFGSSTLSADGRSRLREFIPEYVGVLLSPEFRPHIAQIIIEGHTDNVGTYLTNLELSQARAMAVASYILGQDFPQFPQKAALEQYLTANGRSFSQLKATPKESRRVEFKFRLKDEESIRQVQELLEGRTHGS